MNSNITYRDLRQRTIDISNFIYNIIQSLGTIVGIIAWSLLDVALGGILYSLVFKDVDISFFGIAPLGTVLGWSLSISLWFIQITVWRYIQETKGFNWKNRTMAIALVVGLLLALLDTFGDASPIILFVQNSEIVSQANLIPLLGTSLGKLISNSILWITILLTGFGEPLNTLIFRNANPVLISKTVFQKPKPTVTRQKPDVGFPFQNVGQGKPFGGRK